MYKHWFCFSIIVPTTACKKFEFHVPVSHTLSTRCDFVIPCSKGQREVTIFKGMDHKNWARNWYIRCLLSVGGKLLWYKRILIYPDLIYIWIWYIQQMVSDTKNDFCPGGKIVLLYPDFDITDFDKSGFDCIYLSCVLFNCSQVEDHPFCWLCQLHSRPQCCR